MEDKPVFDAAIDQMLQSLKSEDEMTDKQRRILESAIKIFAEKGFNGSSTSEIARDAGVAEGTIFRHFKTKKDLLYALIAPMVMKFASPLILKDVKKIMSGKDLPAEQIFTELFKNRIELIEKNWPRMKIILQEAQFHPEIMDALVDNLAQRARDIGEGFVKDRIATGELRQLPPTVILRTAFSMILGYLFFQRLFPADSLNSGEDIQLMVDVLMNGIKA